MPENLRQFTTSGQSSSRAALATVPQLKLNRPALLSTRNSGQAPYRIALYSHDTMGLGHMRRNMLIAQTLAAPPLEATVLLVAGAHQVNSFALPSGVDCLTLPALFKNTDGKYQSRSLDLSLEGLVTLRGNAIRAALEAFQPDVLIVDKVPRGACRELDPTLEYLRAQGHTRCVLGLRDILDDPDTVQAEWHSADHERAIRDHYDAIWIYGDPMAYDMVQEYDLSAGVAAKVQYTGYLDQRNRFKPVNSDNEAVFAALGLPPGKLALCLLGGGQDGPRLAEAFAEADLPPGYSGLVVTGPFMPPATRERLQRLAAIRPRMRVVEFFPEPTLLISRADRIVAMGGYNTTCEILSYGKPALIIPRVKPRLEQLIRAERLNDLGLLDVLHPDQATPAMLAAWLKRDLSLPPVHDRIDLNGLDRLPGLLQELLFPRSSSISHFDQGQELSYVHY